MIRLQLIDGNHSGRKAMNGIMVTAAFGVGSGA